MTTKLVRIGNSKGIILSKSIIEHANLNGELTLELSKEGVIIRPAKSTKRKNWDKQFKKVKKSNKPEKLLLGSWGNDFDKNGWEWK
jgi:antitoxin MazE